MLLNNSERRKNMPSFHNSESRQYWPENLGILAIELYFPSQFVDQSELEVYDGISAGKYTIGLGQTSMGFCCDREDIYSLCLTVVNRLLERTGVDLSAIGRLEVGTETIIDKSKSIKSVLMQLFEESGNTEVEGVDNINACYGGTAALFNSLAWIESSAWDGRYALVVAGDIAVYAEGNARSTGGAGAVAMLVGPDAPLVIDRGLRGTHMQHVYDFYKPDLLSEYPVVDGKLSIQCYLTALDKCYERYKRRAAAPPISEGFPKIFTVNSVDAMIFHSPYCKLVQKSVARLVFNDFLSVSASEQAEKYKELYELRDLKLEETYLNRDVEKLCVEFSKDIFNEKTVPSLLVAKLVGNMYTPSLYGCLASFFVNKLPADVAGKHLLLFSYGSGSAASMFSLTVSDNVSPGSSLHKLCNYFSDVQKRLTSRRKASPAEFSEVMRLREKTSNKAPYFPQTSIDKLFTGTWYLTEVDEMHRRKYERKLHESDVEGQFGPTAAKVSATMEGQSASSLHHSTF